MFTLLSVAWFWVLLFSIEGENVYFHLDFVDNLYANIGTTPDAVFNVVFWPTWIIGWFLFMLWEVGYVDRWKEML